jgi:hypothetical protein
MARTYKKTLGFCDRNPWMKRYADRRLRCVSLEKTLACGRAYARYTCPWDICDWKHLYWTEAEFRRDRHRFWQNAQSRGWEPECNMAFEDFFKEELIRYRKR